MAKQLSVHTIACDSWSKARCCADAVCSVVLAAAMNGLSRSSGSQSDTPRPSTYAFNDPYSWTTQSTRRTGIWKMTRLQQVHPLLNIPVKFKIKRIARFHWSDQTMSCHSAVSSAWDGRQIRKVHANDSIAVNASLISCMPCCDIHMQKLAACCASWHFSFERRTTPT